MDDVSDAPHAVSHILIDGPVPWAMFDQASEAWVWRARDEGEVWIGLGEAERFAGMEECSAHLRALQLPAGTPGLRAFAAIAFDPDSPALDPWSDFPPRWFVLPQLLLHWHAGRLNGIMLSSAASANMDAIIAQIRVPADADAAGFAASSDSATPLVWREVVERVKERIAARRVEKVVLARTKDLARREPQTEFKSSPVLRRLHAANDSYLFACKRNGTVFISASPERLLRVSGRRLETESLAGTRPRGATTGDDFRFAAELLQSDKDMREQQIVTDYLTRGLRDIGCSGIEPSPPMVRKHSAAQHLCTEIRAQLPPTARADRVLAALHPTPAVCGQPAGAARELIRALEAVPRGYYAGAMGCVNAEGFELAVGIRSALIADNRALLFAGAGIVAGSDPDAEWQETEIKLQPMQNALSGARD